MPDPLDTPARAVQVLAPALPLARRVVLLVGALLYLTSRDLPSQSIANIVGAWVGESARSDARGWILAVNLLVLVTQLSALLLAGSVAMRLARGLRLRRSVPSGPVLVRATGAGLSVEGRLVLARKDVASAEVTLDPNGGYVVVARSRSGVTTWVCVRTEAEAQALASALLPSRPSGALVFEGVAAGRGQETLAAAGLLAAAAGAELARELFAGPLWAWAQLLPGGPDFTSHPEGLAFWVVFGAYGLGIWGVLALAALAVKPVVRRMLPGRVGVDATGVTLDAALNMSAGDGVSTQGGTRIAAEDIVRVDADESPQVTLALRSGQQVRLRFAADRPVLDRDAFVARVRALIQEHPVAMYPASETSGVRIARTEGAAGVAEREREEVEDDSEADDAPSLQAPRARRR
jgi:hypothetical protein